MGRVWLVCLSWLVPQPPAPPPGLALPFLRLYEALLLSSPSVSPSGHPRLLAMLPSALRHVGPTFTLPPQALPRLLPRWTQLLGLALDKDPAGR